MCSSDLAGRRSRGPRLRQCRARRRQRAGRRAVAASLRPRAARGALNAARWRSRRLALHGAKTRQTFMALLIPFCPFFFASLSIAIGLSGNCAEWHFHPLEFASVFDAAWRLRQARARQNPPADKPQAGARAGAPAGSLKAAARWPARPRRPAIRGKPVRERFRPAAKTQRRVYSDRKSVV